jgi:hypothetical protein
MSCQLPLYWCTVPKPKDLLCLLLCISCLYSLFLENLVDASGLELFPGLVSGNIPNARGFVVADENLLRASMRAIHPNNATFTVVVGHRRFDHNVSRNGALGVVTAVGDLVVRIDKSPVGGPSKHFSQRAKLVRSLPAELDVSVLFARRKLGIETEAVLFDLKGLQKLLCKCRVFFELDSLRTKLIPTKYAQIDHLCLLSSRRGPCL